MYMATIRLATTTIVVSLIVSWRSGHLTRSNSTLTERKKASRPVFFEFDGGYFNTRSCWFGIQ